MEEEITNKLNSIFNDRFMKFFETCRMAVTNEEIGTAVAIEMAIAGAQCHLYEAYKEKYDKLFDKYNDVLDLSAIYPEIPLPKLNEIYDSVVFKFRSKMDSKSNVIELIQSYTFEV